MSLMGVSTKGRLIGKVPYEVILDFLKEKYDKNAYSEIKNDRYEMIDHFEKYNDSDKWEISSGFIYFNDGEEDRMLSYFYQNINPYENLDYYERFGLAEMVKSETTTISLGCNDKAKEVIKSIVEHFGGWYDEDDCDGNPYIKIEKNQNYNYDYNKDVIHITRDELNRKFGAIVIIDD